MFIGETISKLRANANMSQEQFAELFGVSRQSVQKWESNLSVPELEKLVKIAKYFDISLDALVLKSDNRVIGVLPYLAVSAAPAAGVAAPDEKQLRRADALALVAVAQQRQAGDGQRRGGRL